jgi:hypothetical protein
VAGADNLRTPTTEEARERGKKGGIASGKARRKKKALNDTLSELLSMPVKDGRLNDLESIKSLASMKGKNITVQEAIVLAQIQKALKGDQRAARLLFEVLGDHTQGTTTQTESHNALIEAIRSRSHED